MNALSTMNISKGRLKNPSIAEGRDLKLSPTEQSSVDSAIQSFLLEDIGSGDITANATLSPDAVVVALVTYKEPAVVAGLDIAFRVFHLVDPAIDITIHSGNGTRLESAPAIAATVKGSARSVLTAERTALNLLQRLSGIATITKQFVELAEPLGIAILDTRKTTPGLRLLEKYAVRIGGGINHRFGLFDGILIKDNHISLTGGVRQAVTLARSKHLSQPIEVETTTLEEVEEAINCGVETVMLDNMPPEMIASAVKLIGGHAVIEVSGGITLNNIHQYLIAGVDAISIGALTHSARNIDISLEVERLSC